VTGDELVNFQSKALLAVVRRLPKKITIPVTIVVLIAIFFSTYGLPYMDYMDLIQWELGGVR
jgi:hypothetical protein